MLYADDRVVFGGGVDLEPREVFLGDRHVRVDGFDGAFGEACVAVDAGVGINIDPRPFCNRLPGDHALYGANVNATAVTNA